MTQIQIRPELEAWPVIPEPKPPEPEPDPEPPNPIAEYLQDAWSLIDARHKWCQWAMSRKDGSYCSIGALRRVQNRDGRSGAQFHKAAELLAVAAGRPGGSFAKWRVAAYNDRSHYSDVRRMWADAIALAKRGDK